MGSWPGLSPREEEGPGEESELSWEVSWLDMEEPEGRMGALLKSAGEKSLQREEEEDDEDKDEGTVSWCSFSWV